MASVFLGAGEPGGSNGDIQYNDNGAFGGSDALTIDGDTIEIADIDVGHITGTGTGDYIAFTASNTDFSSDPDTGLHYGQYADGTGFIYAGDFTSEIDLFQDGSIYNYINNRDTGGTVALLGLKSIVGVQGTATATATYNLLGSTTKAVGATITRAYGVKIESLSHATIGNAVTNYPFWYSGGGGDAALGAVFRINHLGILAYYNPAFAEYTPDTANYERIVLQWDSNVAQIGTQAGGTGTLRAVKILGSSLQADGYKSSDGTAGATAGPFTVITGITVKNGLVTALTGS
jgi:hypothetical protein